MGRMQTMRDEKVSGPKQAKGKRTNASATVRPVLSFRALAELFENVKGRADATQRAISEELESLVRLALDITEHRATEFVMKTIGTSIALAEITTGKKWNEDKSTALMAHSAACTASAMMLFPYKDALDESALGQKASAAGEVLAQRSVGIFAGLTADKVQEIGQSKMLDFMFAEAERQAGINAMAHLLREGAPAPSEPTADE